MLGRMIVETLVLLIGPIRKFSITMRALPLTSIAGHACCAEGLVEELASWYALYQIDHTYILGHAM